ncbi:Uncharacterized protein PBTT_09347 [Plasmodiophora brassicae]
MTGDDDAVLAAVSCRAFHRVAGRDGWWMKWVASDAGVAVLASDLVDVYAGAEADVGARFASLNPSLQIGSASAIASVLERALQGVVTPGDGNPTAVFDTISSPGRAVLDVRVPIAAGGGIHWRQIIAPMLAVSGATTIPGVQIARSPSPARPAHTDDDAAATTDEEAPQDEQQQEAAGLDKRRQRLRRDALKRKYTKL